MVGRVFCGWGFLLLSLIFQSVQGAAAQVWPDHACIHALETPSARLMELENALHRFQESTIHPETGKSLGVPYTDLIKPYDLSELDPVGLDGVMAFGPKDAELLKNSLSIVIAVSGFGAVFSRATSMLNLITMAQAVPDYKSKGWLENSLMASIAELRGSHSKFRPLPVLAIDIPGMGFTKQKLDTVTTRQQLGAWMDHLIGSVRKKYGARKKIILALRSGSGIIAAESKAYDAALLVSPMVPGNLRKEDSMISQNQRSLKQYAVAKNIQINSDIEDWMFQLHHYQGSLIEYVGEASYLSGGTKPKETVVYTGVRDKEQVLPREVDFWNQSAQVYSSTLKHLRFEQGNHDPFAFDRFGKKTAPALILELDRLAGR